MVLKTYYRYREVRDRRAYQLIQAWLASLPAGMEKDYTYPELEEELLLIDEALHMHASVPRPAGIRPLLERYVELFRAAGFGFSFHRTNATRYVRVTPSVTR